MKITANGVYLNCPICKKEFLFANEEGTFGIKCPNCSGKKTCANCYHNFSKRHLREVFNEDYNHEDLVCDYWESDGLTDNDFCSKWKYEGDGE